MASGQSLPGQASPPLSAIEERLLGVAPEILLDRAKESGSAARGAILFHGPLLGCAKCHSVGAGGSDVLGPNLARPQPDGVGPALVESVLKPSAEIAEEYRSIRILTDGGLVKTGILVADDDDSVVVLRDPVTLQNIRIPVDEIAQRQVSQQSAMPEGLMRSLANEAEFLDLLKYLLEIREGGPKRARELQPNSAQLAIQLPEYESHIDHAGMIGSWDAQSLERGKAVYMGLCVNCHGTRTQPGSLATALRFGEGKFKYGSDPYSMYQTLTRGSGLMLPQPWMVPQQKYDVIHYLREEFLRDRGPTRLPAIDGDYLAGLPPGDQRGPAPQKIEPWSQADYGPRLINTYEIGRGGRNIAQKGIAIQLDGSPGGVAHGQAWVIFDHDTMRVAGVWTSRGFIDWQGIHFNGRHGIHPHIVGDVLLANPTGPGWAHPDSGILDDTARVLGRDGKQYGPLPRDWAKYQGIYQVGRQSRVAYRVGNTNVREQFRWGESPASDGQSQQGFFARDLTLGPRDRSLELVVATLDQPEATWNVEGPLASESRPAPASSAAADASQFDGTRYYQVSQIADLDMFGNDFTIRARLSTTEDGTIFSRTPRADAWKPDGQSLFIRGGRLCYDVGWVGAVQSSTRINDGRPHDVALTWRKRTGLASLWVDGRRVAKKRLQPKKELGDAVIRIGRTASNFPEPSSFQSGTIDSVQFFGRELEPSEISDADEQAGLLASWQLGRQVIGNAVVDATGNGHQAQLIADSLRSDEPLIAGFDCAETLTWKPRGGRLVLQVPAGQTPLALTVWSAKTTNREEIDFAQVWAATARPPSEISQTDEAPVRAEPIFPEVIETTVVRGTSQNGFAVDVLTVPKTNPWQAQVRVAGLDFFADPDRMAVCTWDGDVWVVAGLEALASREDEPVKLSWRRCAFGLFQPLGLKIVDETIFLTCRDQLVRLDDRNGDGEIDYYHCVNNDHQVTEHFHEFAMGLQTDSQGNFYYAKSARHALTAVVPHHGTLLRIPPDGSRTDILATGFRAANGVCLNPDGTFIVTDQEGHWNPKNRINWVREGGFYGNMYGYHDVTDSSDQAMEPPLCWITNRFDRSPAELLWVDSPAWGPLNGRLLNLSYGYGKVYVVPHEQTEAGMQGGMCSLPIPDFPTGIVRGRFSPHDHQLYLAGLAAWGTNQTMEAGGLYRLRYTGEPAALPVELQANRQGLVVGFSEPLGAETSRDPKDYGVEVWSLRRSKNYGSEHYDQHELEITEVELSADRRTLSLAVADIAPTRGMEIRLLVTTDDGRQVERVIHNSIRSIGHQVRPDSQNGPSGARRLESRTSAGN